MRIKPALLTMTIAALTLTACSAPTITPAPPAHQAAAKAATKTATKTATDGSAKFGDTATFTDGLKATVTAHTVKAGQYAAGAVNGRILVVTIKLTNPTKTAINAVMSSVPTVEVGTDGKAANMASDISINAGSISDILPGETQTANTGWGVATTDLALVRVSIADPDLTGTPAVFKGAVK